MSSVIVDIPVEAINSAIEKAGEALVRVIADEIAKEAKATSAFSDQTGNLRKSIQVRKAQLGEADLIVGAFAPHAGLIEYGHDIVVGKGGDVVGHVPARPFLGPAVETVKRHIPALLRAELRDLTIKVQK